MKCHPTGEGTLLPDAEVVKLKSKDSFDESPARPAAVAIVPSAAPEVNHAQQVFALADQIGPMAGEVRLLAAVLGVHLGLEVSP